MHGAALIPRLGAVRIRSDVQRKRLAGLSAETKTESDVAAGMYDAAMTERTYERLKDLAGIVSGCGIPVIVDATFLARARREQFAALARSLGAPLRILDFRAGEATLPARIPSATSRNTSCTSCPRTSARSGSWWARRSWGCPCP